MTEPEAEFESMSGYSIRGRQGRVIESLGRDIVGGRYAPEALLPKESELTEKFGVSRTPLREAVKVLAAKGLLDIRPKVGTRVRRRPQWNVFDSDILRWQTLEGDGESVMRDLIEIRQILEPAAAQLAASRAGLSDLSRLERASARMLAHVADHDRYAASDVAFHLVVYEASHNELLQRFGHLVADFMQLSFDVQQRARAQGSVDFTEDARGHQAVYDSINRGDPAAAGSAMLAVVLDGKSALIEALTSLRDSPFE